MASDPEFVDFLVDQMKDAGVVRSRKMFGEYALYAGDKVVALVCDNRLFVKPTPGGRAFIGIPVESPPYPGAKPMLLVEDVEDGAFLRELLVAMEPELPAPKPKKPMAKKE